MSESLGSRSGSRNLFPALPAAHPFQLPTLQMRLAGGQIIACRALVKASLLARLSDLAYGKKGTPPGGYIDITQDSVALSAIGLTPGMLQIRRDHFRARVYALTQGQSTHYVVAFAGTDPSSMIDIGTDIGQSLGVETNQYDEARAVGTRLARVSQSIPIVLTGHSLGGGLATEASFYSNRPAVVFNAAGLEKNNIPKHVKPPQVDAYSVAGDPLTFLQTKMRVVLSLAAFRFLPELSVPSELLTGDPLNGMVPAAYGKHITLPDKPIAGQGTLAATLDHHTITRVERDIEASKIVLQCR